MTSWESKPKTNKACVLTFMKSVKYVVYGYAFEEIEDTKGKVQNKMKINITCFSSSSATM